MSLVAFDIKPNTFPKKSMIGTAIVSLIGVAIIVTTAYFFRYSLLYACTPAGTTILAIAAYVLLSCKTKRKTEIGSSVLASSSIQEKSTEGRSFPHADPLKKGQSADPVDFKVETSVESRPALAAATASKGLKKPQNDHAVPNFGNKFKGLVEMHRFLEENAIEGFVVMLPTGIDPQSMRTFLQKYNPSISEKWRDLCTLASVHAGNVLDNARANELLREIQEGIQETCRKHGPEYFAESLTPWLESKQGQYLMVRSSGAEDSDKCANAGGNLSEAYISPEINEVMASCGRVIASYFGEKSLRNRISGGSNPFKDPFENLELAVMIDELIEGEVSGVLFTSEPNYSEDHFRVTTISCSYGHGEGVVGNEGIATDTIFITRSLQDPSKHIEVYKNKKKTKRLAPEKGKGGNTLVPMPNAPDLVERRCLDRAMVERFAGFSESVERGIGEPKDIEFVIRRGRVHIVQSRPIERKAMQPTYLSEKKMQQLGHTPPSCYTNRSIVVGTSTVIEIETPEEVLFVNRLQDANFDPKKHKVIIVGQEEPENSHPVVNFREQQVTCLYHPHLNVAKAFVRGMTAHTRLLVCSQSGRLILLDKKHHLGECIAQGYFSHPADLRPSLDTISETIPAARDDEEVHSLIRALKEATTQEVALRILTQLKDHSLVKRLDQGIATLQGRISRRIEGEKFEILLQLQQLVHTTFAEIEQSIKQEQPHLQKLFHIKTLSNLLSNKEMNGVANYSLLHVPAILSHIEQILKYREDHKGHTSVLESILSLSDYAFDSNGKQAWENFVRDIEKKVSLNEQHKLRETLHKFKEWGILPQWFNGFFLPKYPKQSAESIVREIVANAEELESFFFKEMVRIKEEIASLQDNLNTFSDPKTFEKAWEKVQNVGNLLSDSQYREEFMKASPLCKTIYIQMMAEYISLFDLAAKEMKSSHNFSTEERVTRLHEMLSVNYEILKRWIEAFIDKEELSFFSDRAREELGDLDDYLVKMLTAPLAACKKRNPNEEMLLPSSEFSVRAALLGSLTNYERHVPYTLEDIFTLIHQNQLFILTKMTARFSTQPSLPLEVRKIHKSLLEMQLKYEDEDDLEIMYGSPSLLGIDIAFENIQCYYNVSLRNHSAMIDLKYNRETNEIIIKLEIFGINRGRWNFLSKWLQAVYDYQLIKLKTQKIVCLEEQEFALEWGLGADIDLNTLKNELNNILMFTVGESHAQFFNNNQDRVRLHLANIGKYFFDNLNNNAALPRGWDLIQPQERPNIDCYGIEFINAYLKSDGGSQALQKLGVPLKNTQEAEKQLNTIYELFLQGPYRNVVIYWGPPRVFLDKKVSAAITEIACALLPHYLEEKMCFPQCYDLLILLRKTKQGQQIVNRYLLKMQDNNEEDVLRFKKDLLKLQNTFGKV